MQRGVIYVFSQIMDPSKAGQDYLRLIAIQTGVETLLYRLKATKQNIKQVV